MTSTQTLLVTGANGYIGTHVVGLALERGYKVRATARSESSFANLRSTFPEAASSDRLTFAIVPDITKHESYKDALAGVTGIVHTASPFIVDPKDNEVDLLQPAINGSVAILEAAKQYGAQVKSIANVSSFASVIDLSQGYRAGYVYTEKDWNPMTYEEAAKTDCGGHPSRGSPGVEAQDSGGSSRIWPDRGDLHHRNQQGGEGLGDQACPSRGHAQGEHSPDARRREGVQVCLN